jgi:hypothetical protein
MSSISGKGVAFRPIKWKQGKSLISSHVDTFHLFPETTWLTKPHSPFYLSFLSPSFLLPPPLAFLLLLCWLPRFSLVTEPYPLPFFLVPLVMSPLVLYVFILIIYLTQVEGRFTIMTHGGSTGRPYQEDSFIYITTNYITKNITAIWLVGIRHIRPRMHRFVRALFSLNKSLCSINVYRQSFIICTHYNTCLRKSCVVLAAETVVAGQFTGNGGMADGWRTGSKRSSSHGRQWNGGQQCR